MTQALLGKLVLDDAELEARVAALPAQMLFTNGVFDILHRDHVGYLQTVRDLGGSLAIPLVAGYSTASLVRGIRGDAA